MCNLAHANSLIFYTAIFIIFHHLKSSIKGGNAWTSATSDFQQYLIIDLGVTKNITRISIQGRPHHSEYVSEFSISYGYNGLDYADFKEPGGNTKVKNSMGNRKETKTNPTLNFLT